MGNVGLGSHILKVGSRGRRSDKYTLCLLYPLI